MKIVDNRTLETALSLDPTEDSIGIVIGNRDETKKNTIKVFVPRFMQGISINDLEPKLDTKSISSSKLVNSVNKNVGSGSIKLKNYLEVPPFVLPNMNPPRYVKGERVLIKFMDNDIKSFLYFPYQIHDVIKRKTDINRFFVPSKENFDDPLVDENSYFLELNSKDKLVRLFTGDKDGEKCPFTFNINTKDGIVTFKDDGENRMFEWNYDEDKLLFQTENGTTVEYKEAAITVTCDTLDLTANESIKIKTSKMKLEADQADFLIENQYVKNTSYEQEASNAKLKYDLSECSGNLWQIISSGLFFDAPATINTGMSVFAGFYVTKVPAPGKTPSVYAGGALDGTSPSSSSTPSQQKPSPSSPQSKASGSSAMTDMKGVSGQPLAYAKPTVEALKAVANVADQALGLAMFHMHPGEYKPLAPNPGSPSAPKPSATSMKMATPQVTAQSQLIPANNFKA